MKPTLSFTDLANRDIKRCRLFLQRKGGGSPARRMRELQGEARRILDSPKLYAIDSVHPVSGLEFRRKNVGQLTLIYAYLEPTASEPKGVVSIRRVRHGAEEDVMFRVEERRRKGVRGSQGLSTRQQLVFRPGCQGTLARPSREGTCVEI